MVESWVKELVDGVSGGAPFKIGDIVTHPSGRKVMITGGQYWGEHGISNFWNWREVLPSGKLGKPESGYGWQPSASSKVN